MVYKEFQDLKLSALGMGAMRLPVFDGSDEEIDEAGSPGKTSPLDIYSIPFPSQALNSLHGNPTPYQNN